MNETDSLEKLLRLCPYRNWLAAANEVSLSMDVAYDCFLRK